MDKASAERLKPSEADDAAPLFATKPKVRDEMPVNSWAIAGLVVLALVSALLLLGRHKPPAAPRNTLLPEDAYAAHLPLTQLAMSESTSLSGGKSTFIDGHIRNTGPSTLSGVTVQVIFRNDEAMPPQIETLPLALIRAREPYIDTELVSAAPLKPQDEREFRLIVENISSSWNGQVPEIHVTHVTIK